ncbi:hypothetical protein ACO0LG_10255 [Undibacterium sp. Ji42W]|uniref:hypothetical protein n=1 Tax=Undibacterium sp. Ji42W TaxID=3413039 RepID=UPI003BF3F405
MNTQSTYQSLIQASSSLATRAGRLLGKWMEISEADVLAAGTIFAMAPVPACGTVKDFGGQDGGNEFAFCRTMMMDIRGANP